MTPAARVAAAIEILDTHLAGTSAEKALTTWARANRFAGSKDRAAIRDHVFGAIRRRASLAVLGGGLTGRGLMIGAVRASAAAVDEVLNGQGYGPSPLTDAEAAYVPPPHKDWGFEARVDAPVWLEPVLKDSLGEALEPTLSLLRDRAPVFVRANLAKTDRKGAAEALSAEGIETAPHGLASTALEVTANARRVQTSGAFRDGLVELQDAASQAVVELLGPATGQGRALDFCAGGGGKSLALAALGWDVAAHDALPQRMKDLPQRAQRAGVTVPSVDLEAARKAGPYDLVLVDAPCSGSGAWRRQPEAKWALTPARLEELSVLQSDILAQAAPLVGPGGRLAYATCSLLKPENQAVVSGFVAMQSGWQMTGERQFLPQDGGDGFYVAILENSEQ